MNARREPARDLLRSHDPRICAMMSRRGIRRALGARREAHCGSAGPMAHCCGPAVLKIPPTNQHDTDMAEGLLGDAEEADARQLPGVNHLRFRSRLVQVLLKSSEDLGDFLGSSEVRERVGN